MRVRDERGECRGEKARLGVYRQTMEISVRRAEMRRSRDGSTD
jgi:hypothetical protein